VLLRHRGELALTDDQVLRLEALDEQREADVTALRAQLAERRRAQDSKSAERPADIGTGSGRGPASSGARGMGSAAGPSTRGLGGPVLGPKRGEDALSRLRQRIDEVDTRAYVRATTEVLTDAQRTPAERLASAYREALYDYHEALRLRGGAPPGE
jgi:hypothetical protein